MKTVRARSKCKRLRTLVITVGWWVKGELWNAATEANRAHIQDLESRLNGKQTENDKLLKENERLDRKLTDASIPRGESGIPLKRRVETLGPRWNYCAC
jgi:hypothetical protein